MATKVVARIHQMHSAEGVEGFEQCAVASRAGYQGENVIPEVHVVGNGSSRSWPTRRRVRLHRADSELAG